MVAVLYQAALAATLLSSTVLAIEDAHTLPVIFFHGLNTNASFGDNIKANLSTSTRPVVSLSFCEDACSTGELNNQAKLAIAQIRSIVCKDRRFDSGYSFVGHSQGAALARLVIEEWDDHKVHTLISLAGAGNGIFYGPQENDFAAAKFFLDFIAPATDRRVFNYSTYTNADIRSGRLQIDRTRFEEEKPQFQFQLNRTPNKKVWISYNPLYLILNNLAPVTNSSVAAAQARRKNNFLKIKKAHYFASKFDEVISPWQSSLNGQRT